MIELDQLKKIVKEGNFDDESRHVVEEYEKQLALIARREKIAEKDGVKQWLEWMKAQVEGINSRLLRDRDLMLLNTENRMELWHRREICEKFIEMFDFNREALEDEIRADLKRNQNV